MTGRRLALLVALTLTAAPLAAQTRIKDIARLDGEVEHTVVGWGLVVGLNGTGDGKDFQATIDLLTSTMRKFKSLYAEPTLVPQITEVKNVAIVWVTATLPAHHQTGDQVDVQVAAKGAAKSLQGGVLITTPLQSPRLSDDSVYSVAGGPVTLNGGNPTTGVIRRGAKIVKALPADVIQQNGFALILRQEKADFTNASMIASRINAEYDRERRVMTEAGRGEGLPAEIARIEGADRVRVEIPRFYWGHPYEFIARVGRLDIGRPDSEARVVINERAGTIVADLNVRLSPAVTSHKNITLTIVEGDASRDLSLNEVLEALRTAGVEFTSTDLIEIVKMLHAGGKIHGKVEFR